MNSFARSIRCHAYIIDYLFYFLSLYSCGFRNGFTALCSAVIVVVVAFDFLHSLLYGLLWLNKPNVFLCLHSAHCFDFEWRIHWRLPVVVYLFRSTTLLLVFLLYCLLMQLYSDTVLIFFRLGDWNWWKSSKMHLMFSSFILLRV